MAQEKIDIQNFIQEAMKSIKQATTWLNINEVKKWDINPRTITQEGLEDLKYKIKNNPSFFFARPILANQTGPEKKIVFAGNQRLEASLQLGLEKVPVIIFNNLSDKMMKKIAIMDNHNDGEWSLEGLKLNFADIDFKADHLGPVFNFEPIKFDVPQVTTIPTTQSTTQEIPINNDVKQEQVGYPVSNEQSQPTSSQQEVNTVSGKTKHICPKCGHEFED